MNRTLEEQAALILEEKGVLEDKLRLSNLAFQTGLLAVTVPASIKYAAPDHPLLLAGGVVAAISYTARKFVLDRRIAKNTSPWSYLIDVQKKFWQRGHWWAETLTTLDLNYEEPDDRKIAY